MGSIVAAMDRLKWTKIATLSEVSYPDLVKAFYVCLKTEEDETLTSMVKGTQIRVTQDLLASLFGVTTSGRSGVHTVDIQHYGISVVGDISEKMGQAICSRNLRKSGFSIVNGVWSKTCVAEGESIIGEAQEDQEAARAIPVIQEEQAVLAAAELGAAAVEAPTVEEVATAPAERAAAPSVEAAAAAAESSSRIEDIPPEDIEPVGHSLEDIPPSSRVASVLRNVLGSIQGTQEEPVIGGDQVAEDVTPGHTEEIIMEEAPSQGEQEDAHENVQIDDAPIQGEQGVEKEAAPQGEHTESVPMNIEENVESVEPSERASSKRERVAHWKPKKKQLEIQLKPIVKRLNEQGKTLTSLQSDIQSIIISQTSAVSEIGALSTEVLNLRDDFRMFKQLCRWMKGEFDNVKKLISSRVQSSSAPPAHSPVEPVNSSGPSEARQQEEGHQGQLLLIQCLLLNHSLFVLVFW
ncbi:hypothetical protein Taro_050837 [Colocasia esculenta]|uniref:Uncharacterized protein n=1 Tax=Colocasia esculenta TaxID=4460 RepID=A0A843XFC4_COLES|nr:hypothetical protein [Colocasia esculenta]